MNFATASMILRVLATRPNGMTTSELQDAWPEAGDARNIRSFQRYMDELSAGTDRLLPLVEADDGRPRRYTVSRRAIATWFMTDEVALYLTLANQYLTLPLAGLEALSIDATRQMAQQALDAAPRATRTIQDYLRLVPDGLGRLPAKVNPDVLRQVIQAITSNKRLLLDYTNPKGASNVRELNVHGLVMKDATLYLIATKSINDQLITYALHRATAAEVSSTAARRVTGFNLDEYIKETHQLSHALDGNEHVLNLHLRVKASAIYHFRERPLCEAQIITEPTSIDDPYEVRAPVPNTFMLVPFLMSHAQSVEVVEPASLRAAIRDHLAAAIAQYDDEHERSERQ